MTTERKKSEDTKAELRTGLPSAANDCHIYTHTPTVLLRPFEESDAGAFAIAARESVASVNPWMPWCHKDLKESDALDWFLVTVNARHNGSAYEFGIFSSDGGRLLGGAGLNHINAEHRFCNLGYWVRSSEQRKGVASACIAALVEYAFHELLLHRVEIVVAVGNEASEQVALKTGFQFECVARNRLFLHGISVPASVFSHVPD